MAATSLLRQCSDERAALVREAVSKAVTVIVGRRRVLSGIRWDGDSIVTAAESIGGAEQVDVHLDDHELQARVIATDLTTDIAILRVTAAAAMAGVDSGESESTASTAAVSGTSAATASAASTTASSGTSAATTSAVPTAASSGTFAAAGSATLWSRPAAARLCQVGEMIVVVGRTLRGPAAVWGSVQLAGPAWNSRRGGKIDQRLELDVRFDDAFEGGAVLDMSGNLIAMAVPGPSHRVLGIPVATIAAVLAKVDRFGHLPQPYIGIRLQPLWLDTDTRAALGRKSRGIAAIGGIDAGSPAAQAHVELGDLLLSLDGEPTEGVNSIARRIAGTNPGQTVALEVLRGGKPMTLHVKIGERPQH